MNLETDRERLLNASYQNEIDKQRKAVAAWKRKYNLSCNDPIYKTATYTQILEDLADGAFYAHMQEYNAYDDETNEKIRQQELDPEFDEKEKESIAESLKEALGL